MLRVQSSHHGVQARYMVAQPACLNVADRGAGFRIEFPALTMSGSKSGIDFQTLNSGICYIVNNSYSIAFVAIDLFIEHIR